MTQYLIRLTTLDERKTFDIERQSLDTIEECISRALDFAANLMLAMKDPTDTKLTILHRPEPLIDRWAVSCWLDGNVSNQWMFPEDHTQ